MFPIWSLGTVAKESGRIAKQTTAQDKSESGTLMGVCMGLGSMTNPSVCLVCR